MCYLNQTCTSNVSWDDELDACCRCCIMPRVRQLTYIFHFIYQVKKFVNCWFLKYKWYFNLTCTSDVSWDDELDACCGCGMWPTFSASSNKLRSLWIVDFWQTTNAISIHLVPVITNVVWDEELDVCCRCSMWPTFSAWLPWSYMTKRWFQFTK